ncbi:Hypp6457 [Branchiostoma lanceolatum]|uniref:Hypp6457 protein n=1 Tax=Branchiostoma lanceolatum TaxID=7740 RepID=A0A8J9YUQ4_BRALA|nr:Hypp6457 [Branchiostoma lanceolatum]
MVSRVQGVPGSSRNTALTKAVLRCFRQVVLLQSSCVRLIVSYFKVYLAIGVEDNGSFLRLFGFDLPLRRAEPFQDTAGPTDNYNLPARGI